MSSRVLSLRGSWQPGLAGGCPKHETYGQNPQFVLAPSFRATFTIELSQRVTGDTSKLLPIGIVVLMCKPGKPFKKVLSPKKIIAKTNFKAIASQSVTITCDPPVPNGDDCVILPCTFDPDQYGSFTVTVSSDEDGAFTFDPRNGNLGGPQKSVGGAAVSTADTRAPPAPPTGQLKEEADEALKDALQRAREEPSTDGRFDDSEFRVRVTAAGGKDASNGRVLYVSGSAGPSAVKVDSWGRAAAMGGRGPATEFVPPGSLMVHRRTLGDLWLLNALGMVQTRRELLERLLGYADESLGMHAVRLFKDGSWRTVVIDDQIPCHGKLKPAYSSNAEPRDGPVTVVQKALAKLYGCYEHLTMGRVGSGLEDLTGGFKDKIYLVDGITGKDGGSKQPDIAAADEIASGVMWARLNALHDGHHLLGAAYKRKYASFGGQPAIDPSNLEGDETLVYPILELQTTQGDLRFVKLRNPWKQIGESGGTGKSREWEGAWGPNAPEWQNQPGVAKELGGKPRDSAFWMLFEDFVRGFNKVYICRLLDSQPWKQTRLTSSWMAATAGGKLAALPGPGSEWRSNPQFGLNVAARGTVLIAISQPDALLDANEDLDGYQTAIGFTLLVGDGSGGRRLTLAPGEEMRFDSRLTNTRQVSAAIELDVGDYVIIAYTAEPQTYMPFTVSAAGTCTISLVELKPAAPPTVLRGSWDVSRNTAGGCPNLVESWTSNPQFRLSCDAPTSAVAVLSLELPHAEVEAMEQEVHALTYDVQTARLNGDSAAEQEAQSRLAALAPAMGFLVLHSADGASLSGAREMSAGEMICSSAYVHGTQEVTASIDLSQPGTYILMATTFEAGQEARFVLSVQSAAGAPPLDFVALTPGTEVTNKSEAGGGKHGLAKPQGLSGPPGSGGRGARNIVPSAKVDVGALRQEDGDDGKIGYAQRMELEEAAALAKWVENVPMMTIEGQPLSDNVKKEKERLVNQAMQYCWQTGGKFEDSGPGGFPEMSGRAEGSTQPSVYNRREPCAGMPVVTQWLCAAADRTRGAAMPARPRPPLDGAFDARLAMLAFDADLRSSPSDCRLRRRPEEFCNLRPGEAYRQPVFYKSMYEIEGIIQGAGMDNRWFISALNIVASNRGQLDRVFFGELDATWVAYGFFVCKFYQDDPLSDDDWQVVLIDDRIPCDANGNPAFCRHPDPNVYWAMIIEKAYAKFASSYEAMQGGTVVQGLEDLTGGIGYKFDLQKREKEWIPPKGETPDRLWDEMMEKMMTEHVIGCANNTKGQPRPLSTKKGLELNRAYAVVTGGNFEDYRLLRLRIPLSEDGTAKEWNGKWSDNNGAWSTRLMQMLHYSRDAADGTFWMEYNDLCRHFNKVYMCRMLDDLWTRFAVKSRWMDETAGGCTNFISWRNNNQWLLTISRPNTKLIIKLTQPDARKSMGNGRHYSNAIGFYILRGNAPNAAGDHKRRKLICLDGNAEDDPPGDFVFTKEPRYSRQVTAEYTFEEPSDTPYILLPFLFEPGREALFKLTLLSDDRDDDGEPDFGFSDVKPEDDWRRTSLIDAWSKGGAGNQLGEKETAGGPVDNAGATSSRGELLWMSNVQYQITLTEPTRCFLFLEMLNVKTDMRDVEGLQTEPAYPTVGFTVFQGRGNHVRLDTAKPLHRLHTAALKRGDGVCLELGQLEPTEDKYVVIAYADQPGVEHKYTLTLYTDYEHIFERIDARLNCDQCGNPSGLYRVLDSLDRMERLSKRVLDKERRLQIGDSGTYTGYVPPAPPKAKPYFPPQDPLPQLEGGNLMVPPHVRERLPMRPIGLVSGNLPPGASSSLERKWLAADTDGDGYITAAEATDFVQYHERADVDGDGMISMEEMIRFIRPLEEQLLHSRSEHEQALGRLNNEIRKQLETIEEVRRQLGELGAPLPDEDGAKDRSRFCSVM